MLKVKVKITEQHIEAGNSVIQRDACILAIALHDCLNYPYKADIDIAERIITVSQRLKKDYVPHKYVLPGNWSIVIPHTFTLEVPEEDRRIWREVINIKERYDYE